MTESEEEIFENIRYKLRRTVQHHESTINNTKMNSELTTNNPKMDGTEYNRKNKKAEATQSISNPLCASICKPISVCLTRLKYDELLCYKQKQRNREKKRRKRKCFWKYGRIVNKNKKKISPQAIAGSERGKTPSPDILLMEAADKVEPIREVHSPVIGSNVYQKSRKFRRKENSDETNIQTLRPRRRVTSPAYSRIPIPPSSESLEDVDTKMLIELSKCGEEHKEENVKAPNLQEVSAPNVCKSKELKIRVMKLDDVTDDNEVMNWKQKQSEASHALESVDETSRDTEISTDIQYATTVTNHSDICLEDIERDSSFTNDLPLELEQMQVDLNIKQSSSFRDEIEIVNHEPDTLSSNFAENIHNLKIPKVLLIKIDNLTASTDNYLCSNVDDLIEKYVNNEINSSTLNSSDKAALANHIHKYTEEIELSDEDQLTSSRSARTDLQVNFVPRCSSAPLFGHGNASKKRKKWITGSPRLDSERKRLRMVIIPRNLAYEWGDIFSAKKSKLLRPGDTEQLKSLSASNSAETAVLSSQNKSLANVEDSCSTSTSSVTMSSRNVKNAACHMSPGEHSSGVHNVDKIVPVEMGEKESTDALPDNDDINELIIDENSLPGIQPTDSHSIVLETQVDNIQSIMQDQLNTVNKDASAVSTPTSTTPKKDSKRPSQSPKKSGERVYTNMPCDPVASNFVDDDHAALQNPVKKNRKQQEQITSKLGPTTVPAPLPETQNTAPRDTTSQSLVLQPTGLESSRSKSRKSKTVVSSLSSGDVKKRVRGWPSNKDITASDGNKSSAASSATKKQGKSDAKQHKNKVNDHKGKRNKQRIPAFNDSLECSVCSTNFETRDDLAQHIFTHTQNELQEAFESAHTKFILETKNTLENSDSTCDGMEEPMDEANADINKTNCDMNKSRKKTRGNASDDARETDNNADKTSGDANKINDSIIESINNVDNSADEINNSADVTNVNIPCAVNQSETMLEAENDVSEEHEIITIASNAVSDRVEKCPEEVNQEEIEMPVLPFVEVYLDPAVDVPIVLQDNAIGIQKTATRKTREADVAKETQQPPEVVNTTSDIPMDSNPTVCECHRNETANSHSLKIEIVLMCYTCKMLFRSMECFETHYRLPERASCNKNRQHGRAPKLFCTNCKMIFSSVLDVRQHLENHARMDEIEVTDFRCNICKVLFIGVGSIFYIHWSNHLKNPFFLASRLSFPKASVIGTTYVKTGLTHADDSVDMFLQIGEYVCNNCRKPFGTMGDLKKHGPTCTVKSPTSTIKSPASTIKSPASTIKSPASTIKSSASTIKSPASTIKSPARTIQSSARTIQSSASTIKSSASAIKSPTSTIKSPTSILKLPTNTAKSPASAVTPPTCAVKQSTIQNHADLQLICGRCNEVFSEKSAYEKHVKQIHLRSIVPQYVCVDLAATQRVFLCSMCSYVSATMLEFEQHWSTHNICHDYYICTICKKVCNSLDAFQEHSAVHRTGKNQGPSSCKIYSVDSQHFCAQCDLRFENEKALADHYMLHNTLPLTDGKSAEETTDVPHIVIDTTNLPSENLPELLLNVQHDEVSKHLMDESLHITDQENVNSDSLLDILEKPSSPDDQDIMIVQDLNAERREAQKQAAPVSVLKTYAAKVSNSRSATKSPTKSTTKEKKERENNHSCAGQVSDTSNDPSTNKSTTSAENIPVKKFLRVKSLAELTAKVNKILCATCGVTFDFNDDLAQHCKEHEKESSSAKGGTVVPTDTASVGKPGEGNGEIQQARESQSEIPTPSNAQPILQKGPPVPTINIIPGTSRQSTSSKPPQGAAGEPKKGPTQPNWHTAPANNQPHKDPIPSATQNVTHSAYHKNLPPCNFGRPTGTQRIPNQQPSNDPRLLRRIQPRPTYGQPIAGSSTQNVPSTSGAQNTPAGFNMPRNQPAPVRPHMSNTNQSENVIQQPTYRQQTIMGGGTVIVPDTPRNTAPNPPVANNHLQQPQQIYHTQEYAQPISVNYDAQAGKQQANWNNSNTLNANVSQHHFVVLSSPTSNSIDIANSYYPQSNMTQYQDQTGSTLNQQMKPRFFVCPYCPNSARFSSEESICYHMNNSHKFICDICGQRSYTFEEWNLHKVRYHVFWTQNVCQNTDKK